LIVLLQYSYRAFKYKDKKLDQRLRQQNDATQRPDTNETSEREGDNGSNQDDELDDNTVDDNVVEPSQGATPRNKMQTSNLQRKK
jgi:hypothetical protein